MKIARKDLENLIIEEINKILQEQVSELDMDVTPGLRPEGYQNLHRRLVALEKAAKSAGWELDKFKNTTAVDPRDVVNTPIDYDALEKAYQAKKAAERGIDSDIDDRSDEDID